MKISIVLAGNTQPAYGNIVRGQKYVDTLRFEGTKNATNAIEKVYQ